MTSVPYKLIELFVIFVLIPISFVYNYNPIIKGVIGVSGFLYIIFVLLKVENMRFKLGENLPWRDFFKHTLLLLAIFMVLTIAYVYITDNTQLFIVVKTKPLLWLVILGVYSFLSVYPQEIIYRTFFFERYQSLFKDNRLLIFVNVVSFSLAHIFFKNTLVTILTFIGGLVFAFTYYKTKSTLLVSIQHAIFGSWLFTVGMGEMLGFPT